MNYKVFILSVVGSLSLIACKKEKDEAEPFSVTNDVKMLNATSYEKWVYYSLEKGAIVEVSSPETDLTWDIAFQRWYVKIQFYDYVNEKLKGGYPSFRYKLSDNENF